MMTGRLAVTLCLLLTACGVADDVGGTITTTTVAGTTTSEEPPMPTTTDPDYDPELAPVVALAVGDLAARLDIEASSIEVLSAEFVTWPDGALGCPEPGKLYTQALVDGSQVVLEHDGTIYDYHAGGEGDPFLCEGSDA